MDKKTYDLTLRFSVNDENPEVLETIKITLMDFVKNRMNKELEEKGVGCTPEGVWDKK